MEISRWLDSLICEEELDVQRKNNREEKLHGIGSGWNSIKRLKFKNENTGKILGITSVLLGDNVLVFAK